METGNEAQITKSTGTKSATLSLLHIIVWNIPFPTAETIPVGPLKLSTQPESGSFMLERTDKTEFIKEIL